MGIVVVPEYDSDPASVTAANLDAKVAGLATEFNGGIDNDNIASDAAIANSKLNLATITQNITHSGTMTHSGILTMSSKIMKWAKGADVASANALSLGTDGNYFDITGTTAITSIGTLGVGTVVKLHFDGILTFTHHSSDLILPGAANITTAAGDECELVEYASGDWRCTSYTKASGLAVVSFTPTAANALSGSVVQVVNTQVVTSTTGTTVMPFDDSIPQNNEGDEYMTLAITPTSATNKLKIEVVINIATSASGVSALQAALFQDSTAGALASGYTTVTTSFYGGMICFTHYMAAGTTSATTFKVRAGCDQSGTTTLNGVGGSRKHGGVLAASITITEVKV